MKIKKFSLTILVSSLILLSNNTVFATDSTNNMSKQLDSGVSIENSEYTNYSEDTTIDIGLNGKSSILKNVLKGENSNTAPINAQEISENTAYDNSFVEDDEVLWYKINTDDINKLTLFLDIDSEGTYLTRVYKLDDTTLTQLTYSANIIFGDEDQLSFLPEDGWYYIAVQCMDGDKDFSLTAASSDDYSDNEPNDSFLQANEYTDYIDTIDTLDTDLDTINDKDWMELTVSEDTTYNLYLLPLSGASFSDFTIFMINANTNDYQFITQNMYTMTLEAGTYYFMVTGAMDDLSSSYRFILANAREDINYVEVSTIDNCDYKMDYGYGKKWRTLTGIDNITVHGVAYTISGERAANFPINVTIAPTTGDPLTGEGTTNDRGEFAVTISNIPLAQRTYSSWVGTAPYTFLHYYDIIPMSFSSPGYTNYLYCQDYSLYHFRYSVFYYTGA